MANDLISKMRRSSTPVTWSLVGLIIAGFLLAFILGPEKGGAPFLLGSGSWGSKPWSVLTYPFAHTGNGNDLFWMLMGALWLYWIGSAVERELGWKKFLAFWIALSVIGGFSVLLGASILGTSALLLGALVPVGALTVAWGTRNPGQTIMLYGIIPLSGRVLAWLSAALVFFSLGTGMLLVGLFALIPVVLAWLYASDKIPGLSYTTYRYASSKPMKWEEKRDRKLIDEAKKREIDREERERLRKLFERSMVSDPDDESGTGS